VARFLGHLPLVQLAPGITRLAIHCGHIRALPYQEWYGYDGHFPYSERHYEQTAPCFLEVAVPGGDALESEVEAFQASEDAATSCLETYHRALLLVTGERLPMPALSLAYFVMEGDDLSEEERGVVISSQLRRVGPAQRELIVHGDQEHPVVVDEETVAEADRLCRTLELRAKHAEPALAALIRTTRPGYGWMNETLHLVAGLEALLVARGEPLTSNFARRYHVLATAGGIQTTLEHAEHLFRLRSDLVHGRPARRLTPAWEDFLSRENRYWTCQIVQLMLTWLQARDADMAQLRAALDRASVSSTELGALQSGLEVFDG
jgi:hypothetical protein